MRKTIYLLTALLFFSVVSVSCSFLKDKKENNSQEKVLDVQDTKTYGKYGNVMSVVPGKYKLVYNQEDKKLIISIRLKLEASVSKDVNIGKVTCPILRLKDSDGMYIGTQNETLKLASKDKFISFLKSEPGTEMDIIFENVLTKNIDNKLKKADSIEVGGLDFNGVNVSMGNLLETAGDMIDATTKAVNFMESLE